MRLSRHRFDDGRPWEPPALDEALDPAVATRTGALPPFSLFFAAWLVSFGAAVAVAICRPKWFPPMNLLGAVAFVLALAAVPLALAAFVVGLLLGFSWWARRVRERARSVKDSSQGVWDAELDDNGWTGEFEFGGW